MSAHQGHRVIVSGSSRGIGAAIASTLAHQGASVVLNAPDDDGLQEAQALAALISNEQGPGRAHAVRADVSQPEEARELIEQGASLLGGLDILVNNAGIESTVSAIDLDVSEWDRIQHVNLRGAFVCAQSAARIMRQSAGGVIAMTSSIHESVPRLGLAHYAVSKAGLQMLIKALALEWAELGIRVVGVAPGAIETEANAAEIAAFGRERFEEWIPLGRLGSGNDVAQAVSFLCSDAASYITGTTIEIDGGYVRNLVRYDPRKG